jgi:hypothetical protein
MAEVSPEWHDSSPRKQIYTVRAPGVKFEVLDRGGTGHSILLLARHGGAAHFFDDFAPVSPQLSRGDGTRELLAVVMGVDGE